MTSGEFSRSDTTGRCQHDSAQGSLLTSALNCVKMGILVTDNDLSVRLLSHAAAIMLGLPEDFASGGLSVLELFAASPTLDHLDIPSLSAALHGTGREASTLKLDFSGNCEARTVVADIRRAGEGGWVICLEDLSDFEQSRDWLLEHVSTDLVTGLPNRDHFMLMLRDHLETPGVPGLAVLKIRLPHLPGLSHGFGHAGRDTVLRLVTGRLEAFCSGGGLLARASENVFALALELNDADIGEAASRLADILAQPYVIDGETVTVLAAIGIALAPNDATTAETLLADAALALNSAEPGAPAAPRFFEKQLTEHAARRRALATDLRRALAGCEFELHYQPQIDMLYERVTGVEALIRWRSPGRGMVSPAEFIPIAEELDLICPIGDWVLHTACAEAASWNSDVSVAVNASPKQFETGTFARSIAEALASSGLPPHRLEIEITESLLLGDGGAVVATLNAIHDMGVGLVLDDFGTGYASLSQLSRFCFDKIKIDRSFISMSEAPQNSAIVRSIAALGTSLGIPTTAEGVETVTQLEQVRAHGCTSVQGYYFSRPVPACAVPDLLKHFAGTRRTDRLRDEAVLSV